MISVTPEGSPQKAITTSQGLSPHHHQALAGSSISTQPTATPNIVQVITNTDQTASFVQPAGLVQPAGMRLVQPATVSSAHKASSSAHRSVFIAPKPG